MPEDLLLSFLSQRSGCELKVQVFVDLQRYHNQWNCCLYNQSFIYQPLNVVSHLCMSSNTHQIFFFQLLSANGSLCNHPARVKFHTFFTAHYLICTAPFCFPTLSSAIPAYESFLATNIRRCSQSSPSDGSYNFLWTICCLKRKIAFNMSCLWKTTTIKRYNCNTAAPVSTWPGQLQWERMTRR